MKEVHLNPKIVHEMREFLAIAVFLALFLGAFHTYEMLVLHQFHIKYFAYGSAVVTALILAKIILVGDYMRLGKKQEDRPLLISSLYKAFLFGLLVAAFHIVEEAVRGLVHGEGLAGLFHELGRSDELAARALVMFCAFIPLFAYRELERVMGEGKLSTLLFHKRAPVGSAVSEGTQRV